MKKLISKFEHFGAKLCSFRVPVGRNQSKRWRIFNVFVKLMLGIVYFVKKKERKLTVCNIYITTWSNITLGQGAAETGEDPPPPTFFSRLTKTKTVK